MRILSVICASAILLVGAAAAQNLSLRAPGWAQALLSADVTPTTGGRAILATDGVSTSVRVTIAPTRGGVARVIRYDAGANNTAAIALRRFTGHPSTGWWLWGSDAPTTIPVAAAVQRDIAAMARTMVGVGGAVGGEAGEVCANGEQAYIEIASGGRSTSVSRACVNASDAAGRLALRLSELAGSRTEEELAAAAMEELMAADRAFAAMARAEGVPAAFEHYADADAIVVGGGRVTRGRESIVTGYANWPAGDRLEWTPEAARVSARGDMGWTWGAYAHTNAAGARENGHYITIWTRDYEGNWRYTFDGPVR